MKIQTFFKVIEIQKGFFKCQYEKLVVVTLLYIKCQNQIRVWNAKISVTAYLEFFFTGCSDNSGTVLFILQNAMYKSNPSFQSKILTNVKVLKIQIILHGTKIFWCDKNVIFWSSVILSYFFYILLLTYVMTSSYFKVCINKVIIIQLSNFKIHMYQIV